MPFPLSKKNLIVLAIGFSSLLCQSLYAQTSSSSYITDGKSDEWKQENIQTDKDTKVSYAVHNDVSGIHILLKGGDMMLQTKVLMGGVQIFVDPSGKKSKTIGINYPLPGKFERPQFERRTVTSGDTAQRRRMLDTSFRGGRPDSSRRRQFDVKKMRERSLAQKKEIELYGFTDESNGLSDIKESPVKVAIAWDDKDSMVYEINIPYSIFNKAPSAGDKISIGFVMKGMQMPEMGEGNRDGGGGGGERSGGGMGGGMGGGTFMMGGGGGMGGGGQLDFMKLFEENSFWIKYTLTTN